MRICQLMIGVCAAGVAVVASAAEGRLPAEVEKLIDPSTYGQVPEFFAGRTAAVRAAIDGVPRFDYCGCRF